MQNSHENDTDLNKDVRESLTTKADSSFRCCDKTAEVYRPVHVTLRVDLKIQISRPALPLTVSSPGWYATLVNVFA